MKAGASSGSVPKTSKPASEPGLVTRSGYTRRSSGPRSIKSK